MGENDWGFGRGKINHKTGEWEGVEQRPFDHAFVGDRRVPLLQGEHPHSRSSRSHYALLSLEPVSFSGHRRRVKVVVETHNYLKSSGLTGDDIRRGGEGRIYVDDVQVDEFFLRDAEEGLLTARAKLRKLLGGSIMDGLWDDDTVRKLHGRLVYYDGTPAVITRVIRDQGCVWIEPANEEGEFPPAPWCVEEAAEGGRDPVEEWREHGYHDGCKVELGSRGLWEFRSKPAPRDEELVAKADTGEHGSESMRAVVQHANRLLREIVALGKRHELDLVLCGAPGDGPVTVDTDNTFAVGLMGDWVRVEAG